MRSAEAELGETYALLTKDFDPPTPGAYALPRFVHRETRTEWILIPGGEFDMGLGKSEEAAARAIEDPPPLEMDEMRPVHRERVAPFLAMVAPVSLAVAQRFGQLNASTSRPEFGGPGEVQPIHLTRAEVASIASRFDWQLPTEAQWEWMCRAGTRSLFFFGDTLPDDSTIETLVTPDLTRARSNPFGLLGLFVGEWCRDRWSSSYDSRKTGGEVFAVRGGATAFWPWQGSEWSLCISSMRMPSSALIDGMCGARFIVELGAR